MNQARSRALRTSLLPPVPISEALGGVNVEPSREGTYQNRVWIDLPDPETKTHDPIGFRVEGWFENSPAHPVSRIEFEVDGRPAAETRYIYDRPDVSRFLKDEKAYSGFAMYARAPWAIGRPGSICSLFGYREDRRELLHEFSLQWIARDYRALPYGTLLEPDNAHLHRRNDIYCSGPSAPTANPEMVAIIERFLGKPPQSIIDVGCGLGVYGTPLIEKGFSWFGVEVSASDCRELSKKGLPHLQTTGAGLPFGDKVFDNAISIEVLEHIAEPEKFLAEIRRVTRKRLILSVPNIGILPYMNLLVAAPWHILEADHKNFFTRTSLQALLKRTGFSHAEVFPYGPLPLKSSEGFPLYYHLVAIADT